MAGQCWGRQSEHLYCSMFVFGERSLSFVRFAFNLVSSDVFTTHFPQIELNIQGRKVSLVSDPNILASKLCEANKAW